MHNHRDEFASHVLHFMACPAHVLEGIQSGVHRCNRGVGATTLVTLDQHASDRHFGLGFFRQAHAHGVAKAIFEQRANSKRRLDSAIFSIPGFRDAEVQREIHALLVHPCHQQPVCLDHHLGVRGLHGHHHLVVLLVHTNAQKFQRAFDHAHRRVAVSAHDAVGQRPMVGPNPHGPTKVLALLDQWREFFPNAHKFLCVALVGVFKVFESLLVRVISRIDANFFDVIGCDFCSVGGEMDVRNKRRIVPCRPQFVGDEPQALCVSLAGSRDANQLAPRLNHSDALRHGARHVHRVGRRHGLNPDGVVSPQTQSAHLHLAGGATLIIEGVGAVGFLCHR